MVYTVTPFAGVWIEISNSGYEGDWEMVTPFAGVWIEILANGSQNKEKGVTPFAGVWIAILPSGYTTLAQNVTPFAGVWIEIMLLPGDGNAVVSLPSRECGLKLDDDMIAGTGELSLPSRECGLKSRYTAADSLHTGHSLRGSVD